MGVVGASSGLAGDLLRIARSMAGDAADADPEVLGDRPDGLVVRVGDVVVKAHAPGEDPGALGARLRLAADPLTAGILLSPLPIPRAAAGRATGSGRGNAPDGRTGAAGPDGRTGLAGADGIEPAGGFGEVAGLGGLAVKVRGHPVTAWPAGEPVRPDDPDGAPWEEAGVLLARLHRLPLAVRSSRAAAAGQRPGLAIDRLPPAGGPRRVGRALARLREAGADGGLEGRTVLAAAACLPGWARGDAPAPAAGAGTARLRVVHGDWHLGQVVHVQGAAGGGAGGAPATGGLGGSAEGARPGGWLLVDVDDLGTGDPAWDLARPAAMYAAGVLPGGAWERLLGSYRSAGGVAVPAAGDPWPALDLPARAVAVQLAALAVAAASREGRGLDEVEGALVAACERIASLA